MRAQARFNRRAHVSLVLVHVGVGQRCRALDEESPAMLPTMSSRDVPAGRWVRAQERFNRRAHLSLIASIPSRDVQPNQLSPASIRDIDDPPCSLGVKHDAPSHLRTNRHGAVDAERRAAFFGAHVIVKLVGARHQHDPAHRAIAKCRNEVARADRVPRAGLQRQRGRQGRRQGRRGRRGR